MSRKQSPLVSKPSHKKTLSTTFVEPKPKPKKNKMMATIRERWTYNFADMPEPKKTGPKNGKVVKAKSNGTDGLKLRLESTANYTILEYSPVVHMESQKRRPKSLVHDVPKSFATNRAAKSPHYEHKKKNLSMSQEPMYNIYVPKHHNALPKRAKDL